MEERWFYLVRDTVGIFGNLSEVIGVIFLFTQFRKRGKSSAVTVKPRGTVDPQ